VPLVSQGGIDDWDKASSFSSGATARRSTSSLGDSGDVVPTLRFIAVAFVSVLFALGAAKSQSADISRQQLQRMFDQMNQQSHWDLKQPLLWGYFFFNPTREPLDKAASLLAAIGYRVVGVEQVTPKTNLAPNKWRLHVERVEVHTVDSLDVRNHDLNDFARTNGIALYDGMDVGPASVSQ
jgi:hypothetical protein